MSSKAPGFVKYLEEELGYTLSKGQSSMGLSVFYINLSEWKLRLTRKTPIAYVTGEDLANLQPLELLQTLADVKRERSFFQETMLVIVEGNASKLRAQATSSRQDLIILGVQEQESIRSSRAPSSTLLKRISEQLPISALAPYETNSPVIGSRFFGRQYEKKYILHHLQHTNLGILGIRRIGKTSLLREIQRLVSENLAEQHVVYMDCSDINSSEDYIREVVRNLAIQELPRLHLQKYAFYFPNFLKRMSNKYKQKIVFFLDEIDHLIVQQRGTWDLFKLLRASSSKGFCQYVVAGYRDAMREQRIIESPFYGFVEEIRLEEFNVEQARDLIVTPLLNLGVEIHNEREMVGRIYEETAGHPNLIQYYCKILVKKLDRLGRRELSQSDLFDVYTDEGFRGHTISSFMENTENREKAIVYALLAESDTGLLGAFTQIYMNACLHKKHIIMAQDEIEQSCDVLVLAGILQRKGPKYFFTSPVFTKILKENYDMDYLLGKIKEEGYEIA